MIPFKQPQNPSPRTRHSSKRAGTTMVELAITIGIAFFFFLAAFEFSRVAMIRHTVDNALYEGARAGIIPGATVAEVESKTRTILNSIGLRSVSITVTPTPIKNDSPDVEIGLRVPLNNNLFASPFFFKGKTIVRSFKMQREIAR